MTETRQNSTAPPRATLTRWLCVAVFLLLSGKSTALEIAGHGGSASWTQIGATLTDDGGGKHGAILSFSEDGSRLLVGSNFYPYHVDVYEWQSGSSAWTPLGSRISPPQGFIQSACLSGDGKVVAISDYDNDGIVGWWTVTVYHYASGSWQRVGSDILGSSSEGYVAKVSLSSDGKVLAIGNNDQTLSSYDSTAFNATRTGRVRIYQWPASDLTASGVAWTQMGETIEAWSTVSGTTDDFSFGPYSRKVYADTGTLSGDGKRIAVFTPDGYSQNGYVYEWKSSSWSVVGDSITLSLAESTVSAASVSYDGNVVAGSYGYVYKWSSGAWSSIRTTFSFFGRTAVSLSRDGTRVAYGDYPWNSFEGVVVVHQWDSEAESWRRMVDIPGESASHLAGAMVSLSGDGSRVAVFSAGNAAKHTRVFEVGTACDTSVAPPNAAVGNCPANLASGSSCQPTCNSGYAATGPTTTCVSGYLKFATCAAGCDVSTAPANGGKGDCGYRLAMSKSCTPTCNDGYVRKGNKKTSCSYAGVLSAAECRKRYSWGDAKFCPKYENYMFCQLVKTEADCLAASSKRNCAWSSSGSGYCYHDDAERSEMTDESYFQDFAADKCLNVSPYTRDACVAVSGCDWFEVYNCEPSKESIKKILSDTGAPPGVSKYWDEYWHDACWYLTNSTCTTSTTVTGCVLDNDNYCRPGPAKTAVYGADGCAGHADFEAVAALGGTTVAEARDKFKVKSAKEQAEETRDSILAGITDESLKRKAKLLADAAIGGNAVKKLTAKLTAPDADTACSDYYAKAGLSSSLGACVATAAASGKRRRLAAAAYDVEVFFSSAEVDDDKLTKARDALKAAGIEATLDENVDPIAELKTINGVDASAVDTFKTQSTAAAAAVEKSPPPPPPPPNPPPPPKLVTDDTDATPRLGAGSAAFASACAFLTVAMFA
ncbi:predicted protein [Micromonas commoda]|uniref:Uncharacterized protein n=1 Tax=Micromonas commoda (strain RCC299 / NOUM17 / CCMP2709) TaxID=296587 RepID=C1FEV6_MICCC|nr:predicted protein [Micromonas commoda]ACO68642.1 predicted protein [Micromonas commoda]|eukprot:XP_002507384.1 predicted protein [Micromonas commoda]